MTVYDKPCANCLFTKNRIVSEERAEEIVNDCLEKDTWFICHKSSIEGGNTCCSSFYKKHQKDIFPLRLAALIGLVEFVETPMGDYNK